MTELEQWEGVRLVDEEGRIDRLSAFPAWSAPAGGGEIEWWRSLAGHGGALVNLAAQMFKGRVSNLALAQLNPELLFSAGRPRPARHDPAPFVIYGLELWLRYFQVRPRTTYN